MPITLIVENGNNIASANTYVSVDDAKTYLTNRGLTVPADDTLAAQLINAMDYLNLQDWIGQREYDDQALDWPRIARTGCRCAETVPVGIPQRLKDAQCRLTVDIATVGGDLMPTVSGPFVTYERVDVIETHYSESVGADVSPTYSMVDALLKPLLGFSGSLSLTTFRV